MKIYQNGDELRARIFSGVNKLADNVASTMGPRGRTVVLHPRGSTPIVTKDGVSVARFVDFEDPFENLAAHIIKQAAEETNAAAGDGTTTATVLSRAIFNEAQKRVVAGVSPIELKRGIDLAVDNILFDLNEQSKPIKSLEDIFNIASISANGDVAIAGLIRDAANSIGKDGSITIKEGKSNDTTLEIIEGFRFDSGLVSPQFITNERLNIMKYEKPYFLVTDYTINKIAQIYPALELVAREKRPLIIIADDFMDEALAALIMNAVRGEIKVAGIKGPAYGGERREILSDLALSVGATFFSEIDVNSKPLEEVKLQDFGTADYIESSTKRTTIVNGNIDEEKLQDRIESLNRQIEESSDLKECEKLQSRIVRLSSSVAVIHVGGNTEVEMVERKHRIEDALEAVKSAQLEGIVTGCGTALLKARNILKKIEVKNEEQKAGVEVVFSACEAPFKQIMNNAGENPEVILSKTDEEFSKIYDLTRGSFEDPIEVGIIDPAKVVKCAIKNAGSAAGTLITTNYAIVDKE